MKEKTKLRAIFQGKGREGTTRPRSLGSGKKPATSGERKGERTPKPKQGLLRIKALEAAAAAEIAQETHQKRAAPEETGRFLPPLRNQEENPNKKRNYYARSLSLSPLPSGLLLPFSLTISNLQIGRAHV